MPLPSESRSLSRSTPPTRRPGPAGAWSSAAPWVISPIPPTARGSAPCRCTPGPLERRPGTCGCGRCRSPAAASRSPTTCPSPGGADPDMTERLGAADRPLRIAIIGAGPAGLYAADSLLRKRDISLTIDVFNRFPPPFGLFRDGAAPDHQSIKAVARIFDKVLADPRVRYFGNVTYGVDLHHRELKGLYHQLVYAVGAQADRRMSIPGEELPNSHPALPFVGWYNGHPDYRDLPADLSVERAVVVGNGNVAMDVARILVTSPDELARTDIADHALERLRQSRIREVVVLGRRGPVQASFTTPR